MITAEAGMPIADAKVEADRAVQTFIVSAEEAKRMTGEMVPIEAAPGQAHRMAFTIRVPRGVVCGITSFNSPLNMVAHKVAPALASGNTVVIKPPDATPFSATRLFELLLEAGCPPGHINLIHGPGADARAVARRESRDRVLHVHRGNRRRPVASRTRRPPSRRARTGQRHGDDRLRGRGSASRGGTLRGIRLPARGADVHLHPAPVRARRCRRCCSPPGSSQAVRALKVGDPHDPSTDVGPMISEQEAARAEAWVRDAVAAGARIVEGGRREGALFHPTILADVSGSMRVMCEEIFAPVLSIVPYSSFDATLDAVNATPFGLAAGLFTRDLTAGPDGGPPDSCRRRPPERGVEQPRRLDSVRRRQAERRRPRGTEVRDAGHDRGAADHHQPVVGEAET